MTDHIYIIMCACAPVVIGWALDLTLGDPRWLPHPVVLFGRMVSRCERRFNRRGYNRRIAGALMAVSLVAAVFVSVWWLTALVDLLSPVAGIAVRSVLVFYSLAGTTLVREVRAVFTALDRSLDDGRRQVARIVGRDTSELTAQGVRTAALETLAENLSDGVVAPLFWYLLLGVPGMMAYKMINTLDSMVGYRTERYIDFGRFAARLDDIANWLPARITAFLMVLSCGACMSHFRFVARYGCCHASPNSGWPEAALAGVLDCRFGGPHHYFGQLFDKPYIGVNARPLSTQDMKKAVVINRFSEIIMILLVLSLLSFRLL